MNPYHYAVVVGIDTYSGFTPLTAARQDAQDFYDWAVLPDGGGVPPDNATLILWEFNNANGHKIPATQEAIFGAVRQYITIVKDVLEKDPNNWEKTRFYFFAAGHGFAIDANDAALLAANATRIEYGRHVSCTSMLEFFSDVHVFRDVVLFADCCRNSLSTRVHRAHVSWTDQPVDRGKVNRFAGFAALFDRAAREETDLPPDVRRGYFSRALTETLKNAVTATSGVTGAQLKELVADHMERNSRGKFYPPLAPQFVDFGTKDLVFGAPKSARLYDVTITVRDKSVTGLEIESPGKNRQIANLVSHNPLTFTVQLPVGTYEAKPIGIPHPPPDRAWLFRVVEGENPREF